MHERENCERCGRLIPPDSDLAVRAIVATGSGEAVLGKLFREGGRPGAAPSLYCPRCFLVAATLAVESLERRTTLI